MKRNLMFCVLTFSLAGCTTLTGLSPTLKHCHEVKYERVGDELVIQAKCRVPPPSILTPGL